MMDAIILAAGLGDRLDTLTDHQPKAMVPVAGRALILHVMDFLNSPLIGKKTVVTGYRGKQLEAFLHQHCPEVITVHNPHFEAGSILSLIAARVAMTNSFLLMNVDHIYPKPMLTRVVEATRGLTAICDFDRTLGPDDMKIRRHPDGRLAAIKKTLPTFDGGYIGMTTCEREYLPHYLHALDTALDEHGEGVAVEWVLGSLAKSGQAINILDVSGLGWHEVDTPEDLARAEDALLRQDALT